MLPTNTGEREKKGQRGKKSWKEEKGEQSQESLGERLFPLHARQLARLHMNGHEKKVRFPLYF